MPTCVYDGATLKRLDDAMFQCPSCGFYYPNRLGVPGYPMQNPPKGWRPKRIKNPAPRVDYQTFVEGTDLFSQFLKETLAMPLEDYEEQAKNDPRLGLTVKLKFFQWCRDRGYPIPRKGEVA